MCVNYSSGSCKGTGHYCPCGGFNLEVKGISTIGMSKKEMNDKRREVLCPCYLTEEEIKEIK